MFVASKLIVRKLEVAIPDESLHGMAFLLLQVLVSLREISSSVVKAPLLSLSSRGLGGVNRSVGTCLCEKK